MASPAKEAQAHAALTPSEVEELCQEYCRLEVQVDGIVKKASDETAPLRIRVDRIWELLLQQMRKFGSQHAGKSKLLRGLTLEVICRRLMVRKKQEKP